MVLSPGFSSIYSYSMSNIQDRLQSGGGGGGGRSSSLNKYSKEKIMSGDGCPTLLIHPHPMRAVSCIHMQSTILTMHSAYCTTCTNSDVRATQINAVAADISVILAADGVLSVAYCTFLLSLASLLLMLQSYVPAVNFYMLLLVPLLWLASLHGKHPCYCWCNFR